MKSLKLRIIIICMLFINGMSSYVFIHQYQQALEDIQQQSSDQLVRYVSHIKHIWSTDNTFSSHAEKYAAFMSLTNHSQFLRPDVQVMITNQEGKLEYQFSSATHFIYFQSQLPHWFKLSLQTDKPLIYWTKPGVVVVDQLKIAPNSPHYMLLLSLPLDHDFSQQLYQLILALCVSLLLSMILAWLILRLIYKPLNTLIDDFIAISKGELTDLQLSQAIARGNHISTQFSMVLENYFKRTIGFEREQAFLQAEVKQGNRELRTILRELEHQQFALDQHAIVSITDIAGNITYVNERFCHICGYSKKELMGENHRLLSSGFHDDIFYNELWTGITHGITWNKEIKNITKKGEYYWLDLSIIPFIDGRDRPYQYISIGTDITERKRIQLDLIDARLSAEAASKAKSSFLANMSHEIRTPMTGILGLSELCLNTSLSKQQHNYLSSIHSSGRSLLVILNDILDFSKMEAGKFIIHHAPFEFSHLLESLSTLNSYKAQEKSIELVFIIDPLIPNTLIGDKTRIGQILSNLVSNAIKFTHQGHVEVEISLESLQAINQAILTFSVRDTGIGISDDQLIGLFQPFIQADDSTQRQYGGTGLGLSIVKQLVELMGGTMDASSDINAGSCFQFTLTLDIADIESESNADEWESISGKSIFMVEEHPLNQQVLKNIFESMGFSVDVCTNQQQALQYLEKTSTPYTLILLARYAESISGLQIANALACLAQFDSSKIILSSYVSGDMPIPKEYHDTVDALISKPYLPSTIKNMLKDIFVNKQNQDELLHVNKLNQYSKLMGKRILLAEDNPVNQQVVTELLHQVGIIVDVAENGQIAVQKFWQAPYDLVLMDIHMPIMDGYKATKLMTHDPRFNAIPILAMTASTMLEDKEDALMAGMGDHIAKPIDSQLLYAYLMKWLVKTHVIKDTRLHNNLSTNKPKQDLLDVNGALNMMGGNHTLYQDSLKLFMKNDALQVEKIIQLIPIDRLEAAKLIHYYRGSVSAIGAMPLLEGLILLEEHLKTDTELSQLEPLLNDLLEQQNQLSSLIVEYLHRI